MAGEDYRNFIQRNASEMFVPGDIATRAGRRLGQHTGLASYTIGQRKGLGVRSPVPLYVLGKDTSTNTLIVGKADELGMGGLIADDINWMSGEAPKEPFRAEVKIRYTAREAWALVTPLEGGKQARVRFDAPQRDVTPGQAAVFYDNELLLGGGIIV